MIRNACPALACFIFVASACSQDGLQEVEIPVCDDANICTADRWDQELFECVFEAVEEGTSCPAPDTCALSGICQVGTCVADEVVLCEDEAACTIGRCIPGDEQYECVFDPAEDGTSCPAPHACATTGVCADGFCAEGELIDCDDADPCTADSCLDTDGSCDHEVLPDGTPCGEAMICIDGDCLPEDLPPGAPEVLIEPEDPTVANDLLCVVTGESIDPDGDEDIC